MASQREAYRAVVGDDVLALRWRRQLRRLFVERAAIEQGRQALDAGDVPHGFVTMARERRERIRIAETVEVSLVELCAMRESGDVDEWTGATCCGDPFCAGFR